MPTNQILRRELGAYDAGLLERPAVVALTKIDLLSAQRIKALGESLRAAGSEVYPISAMTGQGISPLLAAIWNQLCPRA